MKSKAELRKRLELESTTYTSDESQAVIDKLIKLLSDVKEGSAILLYTAVEKWHEIDTSSLPALLPGLHFDFMTNTKDAVFPAGKYDVIVVPVFGFNSEGYRLGHGGGWYDKFLETQSRALKIGVGYERSLVDFEAERHDIKLNAVVTEFNVRDFMDN